MRAFLFPFSMSIFLVVSNANAEKISGVFLGYGRTAQTAFSDEVKRDVEQLESSMKSNDTYFFGIGTQAPTGSEKLYGAILYKTTSLKYSNEDDYLSLQISFLGAKLAYFPFSRELNNIFASLEVGRTWLRENSSSVSSDFKVSGGTYMGGGLGLSIPVLSRLKLLFELSYIAALELDKGNDFQLTTYTTSLFFTF